MSANERTIKQISFLFYWCYKNIESIYSTERRTEKKRIHFYICVFVGHHNNRIYRNEMCRSTKKNRFRSLLVFFSFWRKSVCRQPDICIIYIYIDRKNIVIFFSLISMSKSNRIEKKKKLVFASWWCLLSSMRSWHFSNKYILSSAKCNRTLLHTFVCLKWIKRRRR